MSDASPVLFVATADVAAARAFYGELLDLPLVDDTPFAVVFDAGGGVPLRVTPVDEVVVAPYTALGWQVADIRVRVAALTGRGVAFERYVGMDQDDLGIWTAPGGARVAWCKDPDGHVVSLTQLPDVP